MDNFLCSTNVTLNLTTPVEHAVTPLDDDDLLAPVPPPAAHQIAPLHPQRGVVALPSMRPLDPQLGVPLAEGRRQLVVDEVLDARRLVLRVVRPQLEAVLVPPGAVLPLGVDAVACDVVVEFPEFLLLRGMGVVHVAVVADVGDHDAGGSVVAVLEAVAHHAEGRQTHPAGLHGAGAGHAMAFAFLTHLGLDVLEIKEKIV